MGVPSKRGNVVLHPLKPCQLVFQPKVQSASLGSLVALREPKWTKPVVEADIEHWGTLSRRIVSDYTWG